jgi:NAD(P)-dependent dehydrogenase (short-subunit alcohol dehydrogenase family)
VRLDGRTVLVAGASSGIGRGAAHAFTRAGARVIGVARGEPGLQALRREGGAEEVHACDLTDEHATQRLFERLDHVDVLFANIGGNRPGPFLDADLEWCWEINVAAVFRLAQLTARLQIARRAGGAMILMSSQMGHVGAPNRVAYCTAKHAIEGMTKALALELAPHRIRVNAIAPTFVRTPMTAPFFEDPAFADWVAQRIPLGGAPLAVEQLEGALLLLASDAGAGITGHSLLVDGGWTAQ